MTTAPDVVYGRALAIARLLRRNPGATQARREWRVDDRGGRLEVDRLGAWIVVAGDGTVTVTPYRGGWEWPATTFPAGGMVAADLESDRALSGADARRVVGMVIARALGDYLAGDGLHDTAAWAAWNTLDPRHIRSRR